MGFLGSVRWHLANLHKFGGRENRAQFWPYVAFVMGLMMVGTAAVMLPLMAGAFTKMQQFAREHPDQATVQSGPGSYSITIEGNHPELMPDMTGFMGAFGVVVAIVVCLLAAAVARRLHDRNKSGTWGLLPLLFLGIGFAMMPRIFAMREFDMTLFFGLFINNLIYFLCLAGLVLLLTGAGTSSENKFGSPPNVS